MSRLRSDVAMTEVETEVEAEGMARPRPRLTVSVSVWPGLGLLASALPDLNSVDRDRIVTRLV